MMKSILLLVIFSYFQISSLGQSNCFEDCWKNAEYSKLPHPERNFEILKHLVGCKAPDFSVTTIDNEILSLNKLKGKVVVINFWFTSCSPCIAEMPGLNKLVYDYKNTNVSFISFARNDSETLKRFLKTTNFDYKVVSSEFNLEKKYCMMAGWPTNIVIDKEGIVQLIFSGAETDDTAPQIIYDKIKPVIDSSLQAKK
jgi:peroxiredoxin